MDCDSRSLAAQSTDSWAGAAAPSPPLPLPRLLRTCCSAASEASGPAAADPPPDPEAAPEPAAKLVLLSRAARLELVGLSSRLRPARLSMGALRQARAEVGASSSEVCHVSVPRRQKSAGKEEVWQRHRGGRQAHMNV